MLAFCKHTVRNNFQNDIHYFTYEPNANCTQISRFWFINSILLIDNFLVTVSIWRVKLRVLDSKIQGMLLVASLALLRDCTPAILPAVMLITYLVEKSI